MSIQKIAKIWEASRYNKEHNRTVYNSMPKGEWLTLVSVAKLSRLSERDALVALKNLKKEGYVWEDHGLWQRDR